MGCFDLGLELVKARVAWTLRSRPELISRTRIQQHTCLHACTVSTLIVWTLRVTLSLIHNSTNSRPYPRSKQVNGDRDRSRDASPTPSPQTRRNSSIIPQTVVEDVCPSARGAQRPCAAAAGPPVHRQHSAHAGGRAAQYRMGGAETGHALDGLGRADARITGRRCRSNPLMGEEGNVKSSD